jgi:hypothetical protein
MNKKLTHLSMALPVIALATGMAPMLPPSANHLSPISVAQAACNPCAPCGKPATGGNQSSSTKSSKPANPCTQ